MTKFAGLTATEWRLVPPWASADQQWTVTRSLCRLGQIEGPDLYAIRDGRRCMNHLGDWEYEPMPSSRDEAFMARCRFATPEEALAAWDKWVAAETERRATR